MKGLFSIPCIIPAYACGEGGFGNLWKPQLVQFATGYKFETFLFRT
jgi:hypothetical protein